MQRRGWGGWAGPLAGRKRPRGSPRETQQSGAHLTFAQVELQLPAGVRERRWGLPVELVVTVALVDQRGPGSGYRLEGVSLDGAACHRSGLDRGRRKTRDRGAIDVGEPPLEWN